MIKASAAWTLAVLVACGRGAGKEPEVASAAGESPALGRVTSYEFDSLDERPVSSAGHRGKPTVIVFVTTGDVTSQAQVRFIMPMAAHDGERVNYALVAIHPRKEVMLVDAWKTALGVEVPVALSDGLVLSDRGPFGPLAVVPSTVVLDREGRVAWTNSGLVKSDVIRAHLRRL